ncbi:MAG: hypothetical protein JWM25_633 [Thermoleophilia bacterium]|nr:hypothetical protein [Thermoleophilia bacterium]
MRASSASRIGDHVTAKLNTALDLLAHDLRNDAGIVVAAGQLLDVEDVELAAIGADVLSAGRSLTRSIDLLVELGRCEGGKVMGHDDVSLPDLLVAVNRRVRRCAPHIGVTLTAGESDGTPPRVNTVYAIAERVLAELAMHAAGPHEHVELSWRRTNGDIVLDIHGEARPDATAPSGAREARMLLVTTLAPYADILLVNETTVSLRLADD